MAVSVDWSARVITVPRADMVLSQSSPEVRELDLEAFRLELKALEASEAGMPFPDTHVHETESLLGGVIYARKITFINNYMVEFEDGQYTVNATGANSNLFGVRTTNQVSLNTNNAAGLIRASIASDVWDAPYAAHQVANSMGELQLRAWLTRFGIPL